MGIFAKKDMTQEEMDRAENEAISSIIDKNMVIHGEMSFQGKTRIDGTINGNINGEHLVLSDTGKVVGDIIACSFNCFGSLEGNIRANIITARKNCSIQGRLEAGTLTVEPGAVIDGEIRSANPDFANTPVKKPTLATPPQQEQSQVDTL
ncbi:bactofilin family protein [Desulfopila aestuarii]|uniref:Protein CcmA, bactofilin family n=1 Tax=Desulfopila aestuarii DSM 18488 TaxID=1121416 RepID=A0A1M7Y5D6_9BACT|nr:polymer-forming cytoskeletal protein [Desulfopila aestuarii]SHO47455.1 protein CcmA, bactofilin family [Desulfopila aestuarii DSM 18488]